MAISYARDGRYHIDLLFESPESPPAARQLQALFERIDEAALRTGVVQLFTSIPLDDPTSMGSLRRQARNVLIKEDDWPRVTRVIFESPPRIRITTIGLGKAAAFMTAAALAFGAGADVLDAADRFIQEGEQLWHTIEKLGDHDPEQRDSRLILRGRGSEPAIYLREVRIIDEPLP